MFKYTVGGTHVGSWSVDSANKKSTGITIDPTNATQDIWIVDSGTDKVYKYANSRSRNSGSQAAAASFALAAGNTNPQGIADPRVLSTVESTEPSPTRSTRGSKSSLL